MENLIYLFVGISMVLIILLAILSTIFFNPNWKENFEEIQDVEPWMKDAFFVNETLPLGLKVEEALSQHKPCDEIHQLTNRVLSNEQSFVWLWNYSIKHNLNNLQKELIRISKLGGETQLVVF